MAKTLEEFIVGFYTESNFYSINQITKYRIDELLFSTLEYKKIAIGFLENIYKKGLDEIANIFFYNTKYNKNMGLISILDINEYDNEKLMISFIKLKKIFRVNYNIKCEKNIFEFNYTKIRY